MSHDNDFPDDPNCVGFGNPPKRTRFQKGQSGNPAGRPRGKIKRKNLLEGTELMLNRMIIEEAFRPVTVREGDKIIEMPAAQATIRSMHISAMKGNRFAQKTLTEMTQKAEAKLRDDQMAHFKFWTEYQVHFEREFEKCDRAGIARPEAVPHPEDIVIDPSVGTVKFIGPSTPEHHRQMLQGVKLRDEIQKSISACARAIKAGRAPETAKATLLAHQKNYDRINDWLPKRHRKALKGRIWEEAAISELLKRRR